MAVSHLEKNENEKQKCGERMEERTKSMIQTEMVGELFLFSVRFFFSFLLVLLSNVREFWQKRKSRK